MRRRIEKQTEVVTRCGVFLKEMNDKVDRAIDDQVARSTPMT
jgi:hypothetical protein